MLIKLTKGMGDDPGTLSCHRNDGSVSFQPSSPYFAFHDLIHYAVETTLGYAEAFYGSVASGKEIDGYGTRDGVKDTYTCQEIWAETLVGLLQWPSIGGGTDISYEDILCQLDTVFASTSCGVPAISQEQVTAIRELAASLHTQWSEVQPGETLELAFKCA